MTLEQLRIFVAVAEREHVTAAASALHLTQSAVSAAVRALETRTDTRLFDRVGRRIVLTEAGRLFLAEARAVLARALDAEAVLHDLAGLRRGSLAIAASQTVANYWLPPLLGRYRLLHPGIALELRIGNSEQVRAWVGDGAVDLGLVEDAMHDSQLRIAAVAEDELQVVASPKLKLRGAPEVALAAVPWVFREKGSGTRALLETGLRKIGLKPRDLNLVLELPSNEAVRAAAEAGIGAAALSHLVVAGALKAGTLVRFGWTLPVRRFFTVRGKARHISRAEAAFIALIDEARRTAP